MERQQRQKYIFKTWQKLKINTCTLKRNKTDRNGTHVNEINKERKKRINIEMTKYTQKKKEGEEKRSVKWNRRRV